MPCNGDCNQGRECICNCKKETKMTQHKWHKEIKAWADGAEIEMYMHDKWTVIDNPQWYQDNEYRIKPQPKEPQYLYVINNWGSLRLSETKELLLNESYVGKIEVENDKTA